VAMGLTVISSTHWRCSMTGCRSSSGDMPASPAASPCPTPPPAARRPGRPGCR
jgi:hypothetical protein